MNRSQISFIGNIIVCVLLRRATNRHVPCGSGGMISNLERLGWGSVVDNNSEEWLLGRSGVRSDVMDCLLP